MAFKSDLLTYLLARAGLTALVGARIHAGDKRPQGEALPSLTFISITGEHFGSLTGDVGLRTTQIQFDVWAADNQTASTIVEALRDALGGFRGAMGGTFVDHAEVGPDLDLYLASQVASDDGTNHTTLDVTFTHSESIPSFA